MNLGPLEIIVILVVALLIFGPKNLPKLGSAMGKTVKSIREGMEGDEADKPADTEIAADDVSGEVSVDSDADIPVAGVYCSKCGTKNDPGAAFCSKCGNRIAEAGE